MNFKIAIRSLLKTPYISVIVIASLALGIGATTAIFSIYHQILIRPLPVEAPERLVNFAGPGPKPGVTSCGQAGSCRYVFSYPMFRDLEDEATSFEGVAAHVPFGASFAPNGKSAVYAQGTLISGSYFSVLGLRPAIGRFIDSNDEREVGRNAVAVLSYDYWASEFALDAQVLNQTITINGQALTIIGVAPRGFNGTTLGIRPKAFVPVTMRSAMQPGADANIENRRVYWLYLFARLKGNVSLQQGEAAINIPYHSILNEVEAPLQTDLSESTVARFRARKIDLESGRSGQSSIHSEMRTPLGLLFATTAFVLLIACLNVANLLLVRASGREAEIAVRLSMGANRSQLLWQLLPESALLAGVGGVISIPIAQATIRFVQSFVPQEAGMVFRLELPALLFAATTTLSIGIIFSLVPALRGPHIDLIPRLKGTSAQGGTVGSRWRSALATAQIAFALTLLIGAGLFVRSLTKLHATDLGLDIRELVSFGIFPAQNGYTPSQARQLFERLELDLHGIPGATAVTAARVAMLSGDNRGNDVTVEGFEGGPDVDQNAEYNWIAPNYFTTLSIPLLLGRDFTPKDDSAHPRVAIVNEQFVKKFGIAGNPIGKRMRLGKQSVPFDIEIIGLVKNSKYSEVKQEPPPLFYQPYRQIEAPGNLYFYIRSSTKTEFVFSAIASAVARIDPRLPLYQPKTVAEEVDENLVIDRLLAQLSASFAALATVMAAIGLYGVLASSVAQRTREIGVRMALGARPSQVRLMVLLKAGRMLLVGGSLGMLGAIQIGRLAESLLYQMQRNDSIVLLGAAAIISLVTVAAAYIPAYRASKVDPMFALRYD